MHILNLWFNAPCIMEGDYWRFLGIYCFFFSSEDGEIIFPRAVADYVIGHTTSIENTAVRLPCCCEKSDPMLDNFAKGMWERPWYNLCSK